MVLSTLTKRQLLIMNEFRENVDRYLPASYFVNKMNVSHRTIQTDIKNLKKELLNLNFVEIESIPSKGSKMVIKDKAKFSEFINGLTIESEKLTLAYQPGRINKLLLLLLKQRSKSSLQHLADAVYVSKSTIIKDLFEVKKVLEKYQLHLIKKNNYEIWAEGQEKDKRMCLFDKDLYFTGSFEQERLIIGDEQRIHTIKTVLVRALVEHQYKISDVELQNLIVLINITVKRIADGFYLEDFMNKIMNEEFVKEKRIAKQVFDEIENIFHVDARAVEINYLSVFLNSKGDYENHSFISKEINDFIYNALFAIKKEYSIDFIDNVDLRISLALHCVPLITRIKYDIQLKNNLLFHIKQMSPLAFEIGTYFAYLLQQKYKKRISDDEVAFFAIYFNSGLLKIQNNKEENRVLILSSVKRSESILLEQILTQWFPEDISKVDFLNPLEFNEIHLDVYDIILTTDKNEIYEKGIALFMNSFPNKKDFYRLKLFIEGFKSIDDVIEVFKEELFITGPYDTRQEVLNSMSSRSKDQFDLPTLYEEVMIREELGSTYFGNYVAIPHPMHSISNDSFISVALLDKPIEWDEDKNLVRMVLLVCVEKNNAQAFKLWSYVSKMISDKTFFDKVFIDLSYENFTKVLRESLKSWFNDLH